MDKNVFHCFFIDVLDLTDCLLDKACCFVVSLVVMNYAL